MQPAQLSEALLKAENGHFLFSASRRLSEGQGSCAWLPQLSEDPLEASLSPLLSKKEEGGLQSEVVME